MRSAKLGDGVVLVGLSGRGDKDVDTVEGRDAVKLSTPALVSIYLMADDDIAELAEAAVARRRDRARARHPLLRPARGRADGPARRAALAGARA